MIWEIEGTGLGIRLTLGGQSFEMDDADALEMAEAIQDMIECDEDEDKQAEDDDEDEN